MHGAVEVPHVHWPSPAEKCTRSRTSVTHPVPSLDACTVHTRGHPAEVRACPDWSSPITQSAGGLIPPGLGALMTSLLVPAVTSSEERSTAEGVSEVRRSGGRSAPSAAAGRRSRSEVDGAAAFLQTAPPDGSRGPLGTQCRWSDESWPARTTRGTGLLSSVSVTR